MKRKVSHKGLVSAFIFIFPILITMCGRSEDSSSGCAPYPYPSSPTDTTAPSVPANLRTVAIGSTAVSLAWDQSYDYTGVSGYDVYRNGVFIASTAQTELFDSGLQLGAQYCYTVSSYDFSGNRSTQSTALCATTQTEFVAPSVPARLSAASASLTESTLSWESSTDNLAVAGYKIYRDGAYITSVTTTWARDSGLTPYLQYCYTAAAYDLDGNLSGMSNEACVTPSSSWTISAIDTAGNTGLGSSLARDLSGNLYIGYLTCEFYYGYDYCDLKYATNSSGPWIVSSVNTNEYVSENGASLAVDSAGKVHISYQSGWSVTTDRGLKYITNASGQWEHATLDQYGSLPSVGVDFADKVHIAYYDYQNRQLKYATNAAGTWAVTTLYAWSPTAGNSFSSIWIAPALALDSAGNVHISYYDTCDMKAQYATNASGSWTIVTADASGATWSAVVPVASDIAIDSADKVHISYYDYVNKALRYVTNISGAWVAVTVDSSPNAGASNSIAIDATGKVHISYSDGTYGDLKYATNASGGWELYDLDNIGSVGAYASMIIDPADKVHISYYDGTNGDLKYITNE